MCACVSVRVWKREGEGGTRKINLDYPHHCHRCSSDFVLILLRFSLWQPHTHPHAHAYTQSLTHTHTHSFFLCTTWFSSNLDDNSIKSQNSDQGINFFTHLKKIETTALKKLSKKTIRSFNCFVLSQSVETSITT